jgi:hypothetical protein
VKIEKPDEEEPFIPFAARMGATFLHGAAVTIHKAQGSQWPEVQVFAPDLYAAARIGPDRGRAAAVETAGLCGHHPGGGAADLGDALHAVETAGGSWNRGPEGARRAAGLETEQEETP